MAETTSLAFPNMFNIATNQVSVIEDTTSVANRTRLLILTEPTELYNNPDFGVLPYQHLPAFDALSFLYAHSAHIA